MNTARGTAGSRLPARLAAGQVIPLRRSRMAFVGFRHSKSAWPLLCRSKSDPESKESSKATPAKDAKKPPAASPTAPRKTPGPPPGPDQDPDQKPQVPMIILPPQVTRLVALLTEFGGIYGTVAVAVGYFTSVDPFGNFHYDPNDILLALKMFIPIYIMDAIVMLPDYSLGPKDANAVTRMFVGDSLLEGLTPGAESNQPGSSSSSSTSSGMLLRLRLTLELVQQFYTRVNPGINLNPLAELLVATVSTLAEEMLYRAVAITLLGLWIRDRLFEAGFDDLLVFQGYEVPTSDAAKVMGLGLIASLGIAAFVARSIREQRFVENITVQVKSGTNAEEAEEIKQRLVASLGAQNQSVYVLEGVREVTANLISGATWVITGNLAAPFAAAVLMQGLFSGYQRFSLARARDKRKKMLAMMQERAAKIKAAMEASVAARKAKDNGTAVQPGDMDSPTATLDMADAMRRVAGGREEGDGAWLQESSVASWDEADVLGSQEESSSSSDSSSSSAGVGGQQTGVEATGGAVGEASSSSSSSRGGGQDGADLAGSGEAGLAAAREAKERDVVKISLADAMKEAEEKAAARRRAEVSSSSSSSGSSAKGIGVGSSPTTSSGSSNGSGGSSLFDPSLFEDWTKSSSSDATPPPSTTSSSSSSSSDNTLLPEGAMAPALSSSNGKSSSSSSKDSAAEEQLVLLLEDMLRSPEGHAVVKRFMSQSGKPKGAEVAGEGGDSSSSSSSSSSEMLDQDQQWGKEEERCPSDTASYIDTLLSDPETKAMLVRELEERLFEMSQQQQRRGRGKSPSKDE